MRIFQSMLRRSVPFLCCLSLPACSVISPSSPTDVSITVAPPRAIEVVTDDQPEPPPSIAVKKTQVDRLTFQVDTLRSISHIKTSLDPYRLGPRSAACDCPLTGSVRAVLTTGPDGTRSLAIESIDLATAEDGHFEYRWSPLIGAIRTTIPAGVLTIEEHTISGPFSLDSDGVFTRPGNRFKVGGIASVQGQGLVLKNKVGNTREDLSITRTKPVPLSGRLTRSGDQWILHVPAAAMSDRLELDEDGSTMDLHFTANITAVAR